MRGAGQSESARVRERQAGVPAHANPGQERLPETWGRGLQTGLRGGRRLKGRKAALVIVAVERRGTATGRAPMKVIPDFAQKTMTAFACANIEPGTTIITDKMAGFDGLTAAGFVHRPAEQGKIIEENDHVVALAERAKGNMKQWLPGMFHGVSCEQLQVHLDEFVFRHDRRGNPQAAFQTLPGPRHRTRAGSALRRPGSERPDAVPDQAVAAGRPVTLGEDETPFDRRRVERVHADASPVDWHPRQSPGDRERVPDPDVAPVRFANTVAVRNVVGRQMPKPVEISAVRIRPTDVETAAVGAHECPGDGRGPAGAARDEERRADRDAGRKPSEGRQI